MCIGPITKGAYSELLKHEAIFFGSSFGSSELLLAVTLLLSASGRSVLTTPVAAFSSVLAPSIDAIMLWQDRRTRSSWHDNLKSSAWPTVGLMLLRRGMEGTHIDTLPGSRDMD